MAFVRHYIPPSSSLWKGRSDAPATAYFFQVMKLLDLSASLKPSTQFAFGLIGFRCDEGIRRNFGREGAAEGPRAIREMLANLAIQRENILCYDAGDIVCIDHDLESAQEALAQAVSLLLGNSIIPIVIGGGHELAWGNYQGIEKKFAHEQLGIINFDSHFDMRPLLPDEKGSSGTSFLQIANAQMRKWYFDYNCIGIQPTGNTPELFAMAKKFSTQFLLASDLHQGNHNQFHRFIDRIIQDNQIIYVSLCLDVFAQAFAPGVSAPQPLGLSPWQIVPLLRQLARSGKVISYDIAECSPKLDIDNRTAKLAANFIYEIIHHHELESY